LESVKAEHVELAKRLEELVWEMCAQDKNKRKSLEQVIMRMRELNLENYVKRDYLFPDLVELSQSELRFQLDNMSKYAVSTVQTNSIKNTIQMAGTQPITMDKVRRMKNRLFVVFECFRLLNFLKKELDSENPSFSQLMTNYLFCLNMRELKLAT
jgi:hypothetical protein